MKNTQYTYLAQIYEHLMKRIDYKGWAEYIKDIVDDYSLKPENLLDLGAGDAKVSIFLKKYFPQMVVSDLSFQMLDSISDKEISKVCCDMILLPFKTKFDLVISTFDSINYLLTKDELRRLFIEVGDILSDDGIFTFDASLINNSIVNAPHLNRKGKYNSIKYKQVSNFDENTMLHTNYFELNMPDGQLITEYHIQKIFDFYDYFDVIDDSNLYVSDCYDFFSFDLANAEQERVQFILKKK